MWLRVQTLDLLVEGEEDGGKRSGVGSEKEFQSGEKEKIPQGLGTVGLCPLLLGPDQNGSNLPPFFFAKLGMRRNRGFSREESLHCRLKTRKRRPGWGAKCLIFS